MPGKQAWLHPLSARNVLVRALGLLLVARCGVELGNVRSNSGRAMHPEPKVGIAFGNPTVSLFISHGTHDATGPNHSLDVIRTDRLSSVKLFKVSNGE